MMTDTMDIEGLSAKQLLSLKESSARVNIWEGAVRSGKTIASLLRWLMYVSQTNIRGELIVVSRTRDSAARNVFAPLMDPQIFGPLAHQVHYTSGAPTATILGRKVWVLGSSDIRSEQILRGLTCAGAYVDELTLLREDFFTQLLNRLWHGAKLFGTTNPDSPAHWLKRRFLDRLSKLPDWRTWKFLIDDNPRLHPDQKAAIRRENTGLYYRRNVLGEWVAAEGAIFESWDPATHIVPWDDLPRMTAILGTGIDYGTTNASTALMLGLGDDGVLYLVDEWRYDSTHEQARLTDAGISQRMVEWLSRPHLPYVNSLQSEWTIVDPAAASFKIQLREDGIDNVINGDNDVLYGIRTMASLIGSGRLKVSDRCTGFIQEAPGYSWDDKATEKGEDKPLKMADHSIDGARYAITTTETNWRDHVNPTA